MITNGVPDSIIRKPNMINLLKSFTLGFFQYNKSLFTQIDALSMGNPLSSYHSKLLFGNIKKLSF